MFSTHQKQVLEQVIVLRDEVDVVVHDEVEPRVRASEKRVSQL